MRPPAVQRLVLDAHGVVLSNPFPGFLDEVARRTGRDPDDLRRAWHDDLRHDAWLGLVDDRTLWSRLTGGRGDHDRWSRELEQRYVSAVDAARLAAWRRRVPIWLLSNHRTHWLLPRLERLGLGHAFDRVLVSDAMHATKPEDEAYRKACEGIEDRAAVLYVDDQRAYVEAARAYGVSALHAGPSASWIAEVDQRLRQPVERAVTG